MTQRLSIVNWVATPTIKGRNDWVGIQSCPVATDIDWVISCRGAPSDIGHNIRIRYILVDNISNNGLVQVIFGPFVYIVPQFTRKMFQVPENPDNVRVQLTVGTVTVYFAEYSDLLSEDYNQYLTATAAGSNIVYEWITYTAAVVNQSLANDGNKNIAFSRGGGITYNLLAASIVPNGYINPMIWNLGAGDLTIVPSGIDTITSGLITYASGTPLVLKANEKLTLSCDGATWYVLPQVLQSDLITGSHAINTVTTSGISLRVGKRGSNLGIDLGEASGPTEVYVIGYNRVAGVYLQLRLDGNPAVLKNSGTPMMQTDVNGMYLTNGRLRWPSTDNPSSDANTLDDYERGSFTSNFVTEAGGVATSENTYGVYEIVGKRCTMDFVSLVATKGSGWAPATSSVRYILPFAPRSGYAVTGPFSVTNVTMPAGYYYLDLYMNDNLGWLYFNAEPGQRPLQFQDFGSAFNIFARISFDLR